jgi:hypothetical protein
MPKATKALPFATFVAASASAPFAQSPAPYSGSYGLYDPLGAITIRLQHKAMQTHPIAAISSRPSGTTAQLRSGFPWQVNSLLNWDGVCGNEHEISDRSASDVSG